MVAFLIYFTITVATTPVGTSHLSHVGGFVTGLFPAMMFLPHLKSQKYVSWHPCLSGRDVGDCSMECSSRSYELKW